MQAAQVIDDDLLVLPLLFDLLLHKLSFPYKCRSPGDEILFFVFSLIEAVACDCQLLCKLLQVDLRLLHLLLELSVLYHGFESV